MGCVSLGYTVPSTLPKGSYFLVACNEREVQNWEKINLCLTDWKDFQSKGENHMAKKVILKDKKEDEKYLVFLRNVSNWTHA